MLFTIPYPSNHGLLSLEIKAPFVNAKVHFQYLLRANTSPNSWIRKGIHWQLVSLLSRYQNDWLIQHSRNGSSPTDGSKDKAEFGGMPLSQ